MQKHRAIFQTRPGDGVSDIRTVNVTCDTCQRVNVSTCQRFDLDAGGGIEYRRRTLQIQVIHMISVCKLNPQESKCSI
jgi:hypothetical protein